MSSGIYSVTITDDNSCQIDTTFEVLSGVLDLDDYEIQNIVCGTQGTGSIEGSVSNGTAPYTYAWGDGSTDQNRSDLNTGTYNLTVTDSQGCSVSESFIISAINQITFEEAAGPEGLIEKQYFSGGTTVDYQYNPGVVATQLIVESDVDGVLLETGPATVYSNCRCNGNDYCDCVDWFFGDHSNQALSLPVGTGTVNQVQSVCPQDSSMPGHSGWLNGSF